MVGAPSPAPAPEISIRHSDSDSTMPVLNTEVVALRSGYLDKKGDIRKNWKKRWFVLERRHHWSGCSL